MAVTNGEPDVRDRELVASRVIDAPKELVFKMWTDPAHVGKWWGPRGFTTTTHSIDIRPGGTWKFVMHGPDGRDYDNEIRYVDIQAPDLIIYDHVPAHHRSTITFEEEGNATRVTVHMLFETPELRKEVIEKHGAEVGLKQHLEALADEVLKEQSPWLVITRVFDAPRELVWKMWTEPEHVAKWWGPHGYSTPFAEMDVRVGGKALFNMKPDEGSGFDHWFGGVYEIVEPPERFVLRQYFCDEKGNRIDPAGIGFPPEFPKEMLMKVIFTDLGAQTKMTLEQTMPKRLLEDSAYIGWNQSFEKLDAALRAAT